MTTYNILLRADGAGFDVGVLGADGVRHTMLGFTTETEAEAWIVSDRLLERAVERDVS
jgi:hypothetical protein